jgi:anaerobic selenocysteine-containing dehydrogenase
MTTTVQGTCHHDCPDSCGWTVTVDNGVAVQLRGTKEHPTSYGELCPKVNHFLDRVYSPERIVYPLKRVGPKGSGEFEQVTWDEALTEIASRLTEVISTHGPEAVLPYYDAGNQSLLAMDGIAHRFFHQMGASKLIMAICGKSVGAGLSMTNGTGLSVDAMEIEHSRLIILWGTNTHLTNRHLWPVIERARAEGARLVVIDPIRTVTADQVDPSRGDMFIAPRPGTDIALMLAMMHIVIRDGLTDTEWIAQHTHGYSELADHVAEWTPERAAEICGITVDEIETLSHLYGTIRPSMLRSLVGPEHHENGAMFFRTLACLPALVGAWRDRGGGISRSQGSWSSQMINYSALNLPELLAGRTPRSINMSRLGEALTTDQTGADHAGIDHGPGIHALIVWSVNPLVVVPNAELVRQGLEREDLLCVVHEQFMTDSARYADYVLPATTQIENLDVVPPWGHLWLGWNAPAIAPLGESVSNGELFRRLATAMGYTDPRLQTDDRSLLIEALGSDVVNQLETNGWYKVPYPEDGRPWSSGGFPTRTGKVEFVSEELRALGHPALPTFIAPVESPLGDPDLAQRFPLSLLTPKQHRRFMNASYAHLPQHGPREGSPYVELHPFDAETRGLDHGDLAIVHNDRASLTLPVQISDRMRPGVVAIPFGWWREHHLDGQVANSLTNDTLTDWGGGVAYSDTLVQIRPV